MKYIKTYEDHGCKEFDIIDNGIKVGYYIRYTKNPITEEVLDNPVFEMYYDFDGEEFTLIYQK